MILFLKYYASVLGDGGWSIMQKLDMLAGLNNAIIDKRMIGEEEKHWDVNEVKLLGIGST